MSTGLRILFGLFIGVLAACRPKEDYLIRIDTRYGEMVGILYDDTPIHKANFLELAQDGRFDSTEFQRVMKGFMIQGGDVFTKEGLPAEEWPTLPQEITLHHYHKRGVIAAPRQPDAINPRRASNGSQFYIVEGRVYEEMELTTDKKALQEAVLKYMELNSQAELKATYTRLYEEGKFDSLTALVVSKRDENRDFIKSKPDQGSHGRADRDLHNLGRSGTLGQRIHRFWGVARWV